VIPDEEATMTATITFRKRKILMLSWGLLK